MRQNGNSLCCITPNMWQNGYQLENLNIVLMDVFDREFAKRFPPIAFFRFNNEVIISTTGNDDISILDYLINKLHNLFIFILFRVITIVNNFFIFRLLFNSITIYFII